MNKGDLIYSEEYKVVGKLKQIINNEAIIDLIDVVEEDLYYCNLKKCHLASKQEAEDFFNNSSYPAYRRAYLKIHNQE